MRRNNSSILDASLSQRPLFRNWSKPATDLTLRRLISRRRVAAALLTLILTTVLVFVLSFRSRMKETDSVLGNALSQYDADLLGLPPSSSARRAKQLSSNNPWRGTSNRRRTDLISSVSGCGGTLRRKLERGDFVALFYVVREADGRVIDSTLHGQEANIEIGAGQVSSEIEAHLEGMCNGETAQFFANNRIITVHVARVGIVSRDDMIAARLEKLAHSLHTIAAPRAMSCTHACQKNGLLCEGDGFTIINQCPRLRKMFTCRACETAAAGSSGPDMPCYVVPSAPRGHPRGFCMVNPNVEGASCDAKYTHTRRLCPCVSKDDFRASQGS